MPPALPPLKTAVVLAVAAELLLLPGDSGAIPHHHEKPELTSKKVRAKM